MGIETGIWERGEGLGRKVGEEETGTTVERREGLGKGRRRWNKGKRLGQRGKGCWIGSEVNRDNKGGNTVKKEE